MSEFKDRLWRDLVREHGSRLDQLPGHEGGGHRAQRRLLAGGTVGLAGAGTVLALVLSAASSPPAFAVSRNSDGSVTLIFRQLTAIRQANVRMAQMGIPVRAVAVQADCAPAKSAATLTAWRNVRAAHAQTLIARGNALPALADARIETAKIPPGKVLLLAAFRKAGKLNVTAVRTMSVATAPGCLPPGNWSGGPVTCQDAGGSTVPPALALARAKAAVANARAATITGSTATVTGATTTTVTGPPATTNTSTSTTGTSTTSTSTTGTNTTTTGTTTGTTATPPPGQTNVVCRHVGPPPGGGTNTTGTSTGTTTSPTTTGTTTGTTDTGTSTSQVSVAPSTAPALASHAAHTKRARRK